MLALGSAINLVGAALVSVSFSYAWLTGWRFVSGFGGSIFLTVATIYLRDEATPETRGRLLSLQELSILAGQTLGPLLGGYLASLFGLRVPLYVQAILMAASSAGDRRRVCPSPAGGNRRNSEWAGALSALRPQDRAIPTGSVR